MYFMKFSNSNLTPPMESSRNAQFMNPVKLSKPEFHENRESLGLWHLKIFIEMTSLLNHFRCINNEYIQVLNENGTRLIFHI